MDKIDNVDSELFISLEDNISRLESDYGSPLKNESFIVAEDDLDDPDNVALTAVNMVFDPSYSESNKNYVLMHTFTGWGDMSLLGFVKLKGDHKDIAESYANNILTQDILAHDGLNGNYSRFIIAGGYMGEDGGNADFSSFKGRSESFGGNMGIYNANDIAAFLATTSGLNQVSNRENDVVKGEEYIQRSLDIMKKHKLKDDFHSNLVDFYIMEPLKNGMRVSAEDIGSLIKMKVFDRVLSENVSYDQATVEELAREDGLSKEIMRKVFEYNNIDK